MASIRYIHITTCIILAVSMVEDDLNATLK